jgi:colicin import membrane protein
MAYAAADRFEFAPRPDSGGLRALVLALLAHGLLLAALTWGVQWKSDLTPVTVEAELWSAVPEMAAPPEEAPPPEPVVERPAPALVAQPNRDADIALAKEKARIQKEKQLQQEKLEKERALKDKEAKEKADKIKAAELAKQKAAKQAQDEAKKLADLRAQQMKRIAGMAGSTGDAQSTGTAAQTKSLSASYRAKINAVIKKNFTYAVPVNGNPTTEVEVRTSPGGLILSKVVTKPSGVKAWDDLVLGALEKAEKLPLNEDGIVPSPMIIVVNPLSLN